MDGGTAAFEQDGMTVPLHLRVRPEAVLPDVRLPESRQERSARKRREAAGLGLRVPSKKSPKVASNYSR